MGFRAESFRVFGDPSFGFWRDRRFRALGLKVSGFFWWLEVQVWGGLRVSRFFWAKSFRVLGPRLSGLWVSGFQSLECQGLGSSCRFIAARCFRVLVNKATVNKGHLGVKFCIWQPVQARVLLRGWRVRQERE